MFPTSTGTLPRDRRGPQAPPPRAQEGGRAGVSALRLSSHVRDPPPGRGRAHHLRRRPAGPRQGHHPPRALRALDPAGQRELRGAPRCSPRGGTKVGTKPGSEAEGVPELAEFDGAAGESRTRDLLIMNPAPKPTQPEAHWVAPEYGVGKDRQRHVSRAAGASEGTR